MGEIKRVQKRHLLKESREARANIENLYNARKAAIGFFDEYTSRASEARCKGKKGMRLWDEQKNEQNSRILYTFFPNKPSGSLLEISPPNHIFLKTFDSEFQEIKVWFADQNGRLLKVEDKTNLTLIVK